MTRKEFVQKAVREAERQLKIPAGWWGTYLVIHAPRGVTVRFRKSGHWAVTRKGAVDSRHMTRAAAIRRAKCLGRAT